MKEMKIYLAGGCFWGVESYFKKVPGVISTRTGYANGLSDDTNYDRLKETMHAEAVEILYNAHAIKLAELLDRFFRIIDPFSVNRQGNDVGTQYRSGIYYTDEYSKTIAEKTLEVQERYFDKKVAVTAEPLQNFVPAEEYHQDYLSKNPGGYCHINREKIRVPLYRGKFISRDEDELRALFPAQYPVMREKGTEFPGSSSYIHMDKEGIYIDAIDGKPLFSSADKYNSSCGWPSFTMPITTDALMHREDLSHGMIREEVMSNDMENHLGHVFSDGPINKGGNRFCINGISLKFIPAEKMEEMGFVRLIPYLIAESDEFFQTGNKI